MTGRISRAFSSSVKRALICFDGTVAEIEKMNPGVDISGAVSTATDIEKTAEEKIFRVADAPAANCIWRRQSADEVISTALGLSTSSSSTPLRLCCMLRSIADCAPRGTKLHKSTKGPNATQPVITVEVQTAGGTRLMSGHASQDGTSSIRLSLAGGKDK
jgi:hypothetical protein